VPIPPKGCKTQEYALNKAWIDMWLEIARNDPTENFWAYTKSLGCWANRIDSVPVNLILTASCGGGAGLFDRKVRPKERKGAQKPIR